MPLPGSAEIKERAASVLPGADDLAHEGGMAGSRDAHPCDKTVFVDIVPEDQSALDAANNEVMEDGPRRQDGHGGA
jgi:hypothetical protein